ncbi:LpqB family beta-propeller domain-containing protein [Streptomyces sp. NPDC127068]|uniref:LpqB family beta-propeller domain-containing protein n=1 Tax=Streptomyces sp. NPDC127068 TaxID=3347127 RepID=UPI003646AEAF
MPDSGDLRGVEASQMPESQVRVFAMPPRDNAEAAEIVQGFLESLTSDDPQFEMARKYLTKEASEEWRPEVATSVLADGPHTTPERPGSKDTRVFTLTGTRVATVDAQQAYRPADGTYSQPVHLTKDSASGNQWRIDRPPRGVVLGESDFLRIYRPVNKYYFADDGSPGQGQERLVADPVYVRQRVDPVTQTVRLLLDGPTQWLAPVVRSEFPSRMRLKSGTESLAPDSHNTLKVPMEPAANGVGQPQCTKMAAQLIFTLQDWAANGIEEVEIQRSDGSPLCRLTADRAETVAPHRTAGRPDYQYFLDAKKRLVRLPGVSTGADPEPVPGPLGTEQQPLSTAAVSRDEERAAGVSPDGRRLYVGALAAAASLGEPVLRSRAKAEKDGFTTPSWDGRGDLWVADKDPRNPRLYLLHQGAGAPVVVRIPGMEGSRIEAVRVAADGVRIALLVEQNGQRTLRIGRVERDRYDGAAAGRGDSSGAGDEPGATEVAVLEPRAVAPQLEEVTAMSWAGGSRLVVVGRESGGVQQIRYVHTDGSTPASGALPGLTGVQEIAASDDDRLPLVAHSDDGIVRLPPGEPWRTVLKTGSSPVYPG